MVRVNTSPDLLKPPSDGQKDQVRMAFPVSQFDPKSILCIGIGVSSVEKSDSPERSVNVRSSPIYDSNRGELADGSLELRWSRTQVLSRAEPDRSVQSC